MTGAAKAGSREAQRVLIVLAAVLLALSALVSLRPAEPSAGVRLDDDPQLEVRIDLNTAAASDLETLPGIGQRLAAKIVADRVEHGSFRFIEELQRVSGVGERLVGTLRPLVMVR